MTAQPAATRARGGRSRLGWAGLAALLVFMGFVVYRSLHLGGVRCEVCIDFRGRSQCRTVEGGTRAQIADLRALLEHRTCQPISQARAVEALERLERRVVEPRGIEIAGPCRRRRRDAVPT